MSPQRTFGLLALAITLGLLLPDLVQRGMFMDGLLYTVVAHNQAHGFGTFCEPRYSQLGFAGLSHFHEHPPLVFGIQGAWFRLFGDAFWVERAYCLFTAALAAALIMAIWRDLWAVGAQERKLAWWPVLLWIIIPPVHWSLRNNMQENTMAVFSAWRPSAAWYADWKGIGTPFRLPFWPVFSPWPPCSAKAHRKPSPLPHPSSGAYSTEGRDG